MNVPAYRRTASFHWPLRSFSLNTQTHSPSWTLFLSLRGNFHLTKTKQEAADWGPDSLHHPDRMYLIHGSVLREDDDESGGPPRLPCEGAAPGWWGPAPAPFQMGSVHCCLALHALTPDCCSAVETNQQINLILSNIKPGFQQLWRAEVYGSFEETLSKIFLIFYFSSSDHLNGENHLQPPIHETWNFLIQVMVP